MRPSPLPGFGTKAGGGNAVPKPDPSGPRGTEEDEGAPRSVKPPVLIYRSKFSSWCCNYTQH